MLRGLSLSTTLLGIATVLNYVSFAIFARTGGIDTFSRYLLDLTVAGILSIVVCYSSQRVFTKDVIETGSEQRSFNTIMTVKMILGSIGLVGLVIWGYWSTTGTPFAAVFLVFHIFQINFLFEHYATNAQLAFITLIEKAFFSIVASAWALTVGFTSHIYGFFLLGSILALALQGRRYKTLIFGFRPSSAQDIWRYVKRYLDLLLIDIVQLSYGNFSRLIIQQKNGLMAFGLVSIGFQIIKVASIFQTQVEYIFRPQTVRYTQASDLNGLRYHTIRYIGMTTLPTAAGSVLLILLAKPLVLVAFGTEYSAAAPALQIIAILPVLINLMRFVEMIFIGLNQFRINLMLNVVTSAGLLIGMWLVPSGAPVSVFLWLIVMMQAFYVILLSAFATRYLLTQQQTKNRTNGNDHA